MQTSERQLMIVEDKIVTPLTSVLNNINPSIPPEIQDSSSSIREALNILFPEQQYDDKSIQKAKEILGKTALQYSKEQLEEVVAEIQYLVSSWLDDYERSILGNKTLIEFLHERGGL